MKIAAVSDLHGLLPEVPPADLLLLAGDLCPVSNHDILYQAFWLDTAFRHWLERLPVGRVVGVAGNHDFVFQDAPHLVPKLPWTYLEDSGVEYGEFRLWGTPWQPPFMGWAFNASDELRKEKASLIPEGTDILISHGPPLGHGDECPSRGRSPTPTVRVGCPFLLERIRQVAPKLVVYGHIHEGRGEWMLGQTTLANVTLVDAAYRPVYSVWTGTVGAREEERWARAVKRGLL